MAVSVPIKYIVDYFGKVLLGFDQMMNCILGGQPGQWISYRAAIAQQKGAKWGCVLCQVLDLFQADHCGKTIAAYDAQVEAAAAEIKDAP